jgi:hypothetical protein
MYIPPLLHTHHINHSSLLKQPSKDSVNSNSDISLDSFNTPHNIFEFSTSVRNLSKVPYYVFADPNYTYGLDRTTEEIDKEQKNYIIPFYYFKVPFSLY